MAAAAFKTLTNLQQSLASLSPSSVSVGVVQEPTGQVAQARAERNECGSCRRGLQVWLWNTVHAAVCG